MSALQLTQPPPRPRAAPTGTPRVVLTSIAHPTPQVAAFLRQKDWRVVFVADLKTPYFDPPAGLDMLSVSRQMASPHRLAALLPWRHYSRKNLGYLAAIEDGARTIFDTDDDNAPLDPWTPAPAPGPSVTLVDPQTWVNAYAHFGAGQAWPRGYPLERIGSCPAPRTQPTPAGDVAVWQGLVEGDPDVDAIYRLTCRRPVAFQPAPPLVLPPETYCPFNSQNTWWSQRAFPYLYLPATVTFRFTDILRSLVAQRCFWSHGLRLGFQGVTARQERNPHDLLADFRDELPCYLEVGGIARDLSRLTLGSDPAQNLHRCYEVLAREGHVAPQELSVLEAWLEAIATLSNPTPREP